MRCQDCKERITERANRPRPSRQRPAVKCERCGAPILLLPELTRGAGDGTLAQLTRFGLAVTGDPLLELKREGI